jgi:hypothetical protein
MRGRGLIAVIALLAHFAGPGEAPAQGGASATRPKDVIAIVGGTVIPMTSRDEVLPDHTIIVTGARITAIGASSTTAVPTGALRIDGRGAFVIPGLADMHVHLEYFDEPGILDLFLENGVTTVRNMDGRPYLLDWKRRIETGQLRGPRLYTAGPLLDGHPPIRPDNTVVSSAAEAATEVAAQAAAGYDFIKVYSSMSVEAYDSILAAARSRGLTVVGHVPRAVGLPRALTAGQAAIEHVADYASSIESDTSPYKGKPHWSKRYLAMPVDAALLERLAKQQADAGVWTVPTLVQPLRELLTPDELTAQLASPELKRIPADGRQQWESMTRRVIGRMDADDWTLVATAAGNRRAVVAALHKAGVPLLAGSDTPNPFVVPGISLHDELALLVEAGLTPFEALATSTREAARFMRGDWGTLAPGRAADLVVLDANPLENIRNSRRIRTVILNGSQFVRKH